jgi:hypothetical protein
VSLAAVGRDLGYGGFDPDEPLRDELVRARVEARVRVERSGRHADARARGEGVAAERHRSAETAGHVRHDRVEAERLGAGRLEEREGGDRVRLGVGAELGDLRAQVGREAAREGSRCVQ